MNRTFLALAGTSQSWSAWYHRWFIFCCWIIVVILSLPNLTNAFVMVPHGLITTTTSNSWLLTVVPTPSLARHSSKRRRRSLYMTIPNLPTVEQLLKDPFMKQVQYGSLLTEELIRFENNNNNNNKTNEDEDEESIRQQQQLLSESIQAQLSHPQGIRGFMVSYLTSNENDENENDDDDSTKKTTIPKILLDALKSQAEINPDDLIPLACMNVVMPTAMTTMHNDPELASSSSMTAKRGIQVLQALIDREDVLLNIQAILSVATTTTTTTTPSLTSSSSSTDDEPTTSSKSTGSSDLLLLEQTRLIKYWTDFFQKWGYQDEQKKDIARAMTILLPRQEE